MLPIWGYCPAMRTLNVDAEGTSCPYCGSRELHPHTSLGSTTGQMRCGACGKRSHPAKRSAVLAATAPAPPPKAILTARPAGQPAFRVWLIGAIAAAAVLVGVLLVQLSS